MAKKMQLDTALQKGKFTKIEPPSKEGTRDLRAFFLIVCEGAKTEPNYFKSFPKMAGNLVFELTFDGGGISTTKVLEKALEIRNKSSQKFDRIWIVFDKDSFPESHFNKAILDAEKEGVQSAWSNEAFELWYLLHFVYRNTGMKRDEYQKALEANSQSSLANYRIGEVLFSQRNYQASVNAYRDALRGDGEPRWTEVWSHIALGKIFDLTGQRDRAVNEYRLAVQTNDNTQGAVNEARALMQNPYKRERTDN